MNKNTSHIFSIWQVVIITITVMTCYFYSLEVFYQIAGTYIQNLLFYGCIFLPLFFLSLSKLLGKSALRLSIIFSFLIILVNFINAMYFVRYNHVLSVVDFEIFFQSNYDESLAFLEYYSYQDIGQALLILFAGIGLGTGMVFLFKLFKFKIKIATISVLLILSGIVYGLNTHRLLGGEETNPFITGYSATERFKNEKSQFGDNQMKYYDQIQANNIIENDPNTIILVLGESTQRQHLSLYGYQNKTTPLLDKRKDNLVVFKDVISPDSHTFPVLQNIFSAKQAQDNTSWIEHTNMINVFKKAGYKTFWVSNQEAFSIWGNTAKIISQLCDYVFFAERRENQTESKKHDEILLPIVNRIINKDEAEKKLIIVHLMGTHGVYHHRYPESFNTFSEKDISVEDRPYLSEYHKGQIATYDNAVLYNDYVVDSIFTLADQRPEKALCLYLADHGEEIYDNRPFSGHSSKLMSSYMVEIPFIISANKTYRTENHTVINRLNAVKNLAYSSEDLPFLMYDVAQISTNIQDNKRNILHHSFKENKNRLTGTVSYNHLLNNKRLIEQKDLSKIWVHRVNDLQKLQLLRRMHKNVEVDIIVQQNNDEVQLLVGHDVNDPENFPLSSYLKVLKGKQPIKLWLDIKNVTLENQNLFLQKLESLIKENELNKNQFLLESTNLNIAQNYMEAGYLSSYYIWIPDFENKTELEKQNALSQLLPAIKQSKITRVSFDYELISAASEVYGKALPQIKFLSWNATKYFKTDLDYAFQQIEHPLIDVFLIKMTTGYDR